MALLTTVDNPYNPVTNWDDWYAFDVQKGYNTCSYLARIAETSESFPEQLEEEALDRAMDEIIRMNPLGVYRKVDENTGKPLHK